MSTALDALTGWAVFSGLTLVIGAVTARWAILPRVAFGSPSESGPPEDHPAGLGVASGLELTARLGLVAALLLIVGLGLFFLRQLLEFRDPFVPWTEDAELLLRSTWGRSWLWACAGALACASGFVLARSGRAIGWHLATPAAVGLASFPAFTGHAAGVERLRALTLAADALHVGAAGAWIGGLAVVLVLARAERTVRAATSTLLPDLVRAFSPVAVAGVSVLVVTGSFASWMQLTGVGALFTTAYGRTLLAKLALVGIVLTLGATNFRILTPRLGDPVGDRALRRSASIELLAAQLVLVVTALLVRTSPMDH